MKDSDKEVIYNALILFPYLENFEHKNLFNNTAHIWEAVPRIITYLNNYLKDTDHSLIIKNDNEYIYGERRLGFIFPDTFSNLSDGSIEIGAKTIIEPGVFIRGPAIIGQRCKISHGVYMNNVIIGNNCTVGHGSIIEDSVIMNHSNISHFSCISDSIIGANVNIGFMSALLNTRVDGGNIWLKIISRQGKLLDKTSILLKKFGSMIGDDSSIGANIFLNPGFILMPGTQLITKNNLIGGKNQENLLWLCKIRDTYK